MPLPAAAAVLPWLSARERAWAEALPPALQPRYIASRGALRQRLGALFNRPPAQVPLLSPPGARPLLEEHLGWVSLSHSGPQLLLAWSPAPIGVDLEWGERPLPVASLARRVLPEAEALQLLQLPEALQRRALLESWVRKEAAIKWQGSSLARDLRHWCWNREVAELTHLRQGWRPGCLLRECRGWLCAAVGEAAEGGIWG